MMEGVVPAETKHFWTLSGNEVLVARANLNMWKCRDLVAERLEVRPEMVHLIEQDLGRRYSILVCATFKVLCSECRSRLECACEETEENCRCKLPQRCDDAAPLKEEELCVQCHHTHEMKAHWCNSKYCTVCREDWLWPETPAVRRFVRRRGPKKALPELSWEDEAP